MNERKLQVQLGLLDNVDKCVQPPYSVDLLLENLAVFGNKFSGKTTLLKSLILALHKDTNAYERIIILDFSNNLLRYMDLPLVFGYFSGENEENIKRCLNEVEKSLNQNKTKTSNNRPHYTFIIDGLDDLYMEGKYERHQEIFSNITKKGLENDVTVVFTSYHYSSSVIRLLQFFKKVIAFDLPIEKYEDLFPKKVNKPMSIPGRGIANQGNIAYEFQAYFPFQDRQAASEVSSISLLGKRHYKYNNADDKIKSFSDELTEKAFVKLFPDLDTNKYFVAGVDYTRFDAIQFDLKNAGVIALYGTNFDDKLNFITRMIAHAIILDVNTEIQIWDDSRERFIGGLSHVKANRISKAAEFESIFKAGMYKDVTDREEIDKSSDKRIQPNTNFTIYLIQNPHFFSKTPGGEGMQLPLRMYSILQQATELNLLFIFTNIKPLPQSSMIRDNFNSCIKHAFLAGDIFHFIETRGRSSVFGELDSYELKQDFSRTAQGDGFYIDDESDYPKKLKFIRRNG